MMVAAASVLAGVYVHLLLNDTQVNIATKVELFLGCELTIADLARNLIIRIFVVNQRTNLTKSKLCANCMEDHQPAVQVAVLCR